MTKIEKNPEERKREIISAAQSLFINQGYENTNMQDIMTSLQITNDTSNHYFRSKEELLDAIVEEMANEYVSVVEKSLHACNENAFEKIQTLVTAGRIGSPLVDALHRSVNREMHTRLFAVTLPKLAVLYAQVISQGCKEGVFHVDYPLECAEIVLAGIQFVTDIGYHPWSREDVERRMRAIPSLIENQLNVPEGTFNILFKNDGNWA